MENKEVLRNTKVIGILAKSWENFNKVMDQGDEMIREKGINPDDVDPYLLVSITNNPDLKFKKRLDIEHKNYPAKGNHFYIKFEDLEEKKK